MINGNNMNYLKVLLKNALNRIYDELYEELPLGYAEKAIKIIERNIGKTLSKIKYKNFE